jgi:hypothetical protein
VPLRSFDLLPRPNPAAGLIQQQIAASKLGMEKAITRARF